MKLVSLTEIDNLLIYSILLALINYRNNRVVYSYIGIFICHYVLILSFLSDDIVEVDGVLNTME